jgi:hypothetical protein
VILGNCACMSATLVNGWLGHVLLLAFNPTLRPTCSPLTHSMLHTRRIRRTLLGWWP